MLTGRFGPYELDGLLGHGGMGEVYRAIDTTHDGRAVAVKVLPSELSSDDQHRDRFRQEAEIVARLDEPHVIPVHRYGEIDGRLFLDMQLVDGPDLGTLLNRTGPLPADRAVAIVEQVAAALDAAHAAELVHRDVKPSNILLHPPQPGRPDFALLTDFGIAGDAGGFGTIEYLAPERIRGEPGDLRVDVYALTCVLHELVTGLRAFPGGEFAAQVHGHLALPPPRPTALLPSVPPGIDAVVARGMAKDPAHRYASAGELAAAARAALDTSAPASGRWAPSRRQLLVAAAAGAVTLAGGVGVTTVVRGSGDGGGDGGGSLLAGPAPEPVIVERALGIRSTLTEPFLLTRLGGQPVALIQGTDGPRAWNLVTDTAASPVVSPDLVPPYKSYLRDVALAEVDGLAVLCTTQTYRPVVTVSDLQTSRALGSFSVPAEEVSALATVVLDGNPVLLTFGKSAQLARFDLRTRDPIGQPIVLPGASELTSLRIVLLDGRPCVVVQNEVTLGDFGGTVYDVATLEQVGRTPLPAQVVAELDGRPVAAGGFGSVVVSDLTTGERVSSIDAPGARVFAGAVISEHLIVATGGHGGDILLYDVAAERRFGAPLTGHQADVTMLDVIDLDGRPVLVSAARDNTIRVWDLAVRAYTG